MTRRISIGVNWQGEFDREEVFKRVKIADDAGVDSVFVAEAWGRDAFTLLTQLAERTQRIKLATGIVNYYSRSPAALAQHFATLDELSGGRMVIGLGASSANVIEHFHGIPFNPPLARMREVVQIINMLMANQPLEFKGKVFQMERGFTLRFRPVREHIPVYVASFRPAATKVVAQVADGWMPTMIPVQRARQEVARFLGYVKDAGRDPSQMTVRFLGVTVAKDRERALQAAKAGTAFYIARMGDFYYQQLSDMGFADEANAIRRAWKEGGSGAGIAAVTDELSDSLGFIGDVDACRERLAEEEAAGINLHNVAVAGYTPEEEGRIYERLLA
ncbi:MAG: LLM class flavin-dependent oxidoreductase [Chloroflexota bacterium]|nr:LLM class flavin-dependent oxidoreductase [Chloroflexota bacterium]